jgi:branched-subunit amino acid ABC-type transport system permease component
LRALSENPELVRGFGLNPRRLSQYAFAIGSLLVAPAALVATCVTGLTPTAGHRVVLISIAASIIGGIGSLRGAGLGGLILGLAESLAIWKLSTGWSEAVAFVILFCFILARPSGLFGTRARV